MAKGPIALTRYRLEVFTIAVVLMSCGASDEPREITATRRVAPPAKAPESGSGGAAHEQAHGVPDTAPEPSELPAYRWAIPAGWEEAAPTAMRRANFRIGKDGEAQCYLTALPGDGGGPEANANRWRAQMGQAPLDAEAFAALRRIEVLGRPAPVVEIAGDFAGMMGDPRVRGGQANALLLGLISERPGHVLFVKMIGPETVVRAERDRFLAFCQSLRTKE